MAPSESFAFVICYLVTITACSNLTIHTVIVLLLLGDWEKTKKHKESCLWNYDVTRQSPKVIGLWDLMCRCNWQRTTRRRTNICWKSGVKKIRSRYDLRRPLMLVYLILHSAPFTTARGTRVISSALFVLSRKPTRQQMSQYHRTDLLRTHRSQHKFHWFELK